MKKLGLLLCSILLVGCTHYAPRAPRPLAIYNNAINTEIGNGSWLTNYDAAPSVAARNHLISEFVWSCDRNFDRFEVQFYSQQATFDVVGDFLELGFGGAGALLGSAHTKTILAVVATSLIGAKASVDYRWFNSQTRNAIVSEMEALRATQLAVIEQGEALPLAKYSLDEGIIDVQAYYQAGTILRALQAINQNTSAQAVAARETLRKMRADAPENSH